MLNLDKIKIAIVGMGNCASSLIQGIHYYDGKNPEDAIGLMHWDIGGYAPSDIEVVAAFDVDARKVGKTIDEANVIIKNYHAMIDGTEYDADLLEEAIALHTVGKQANRIKCATIGWKAIEEMIAEMKKDDIIEFVMNRIDTSSKAVRKPRIQLATLPELEEFKFSKDYLREVAAFDDEDDSPAEAPAPVVENPTPVVESTPVVNTTLSVEEPTPVAKPKVEAPIVETSSSEFSSLEEARAVLCTYRNLKDISMGEIWDNRASDKRYGGFVDWCETGNMAPIKCPKELAALKYIKENMDVTMLSFKGNVFNVEPPMFVELEVTYTEPGFSGNTTTTSGKPATLENGLEISVPLFVEIGDVVRIDTRTGLYMERI